MLDVKTAAGRRFLPPIEQSRLLAETMVGIGERNGVRTVALITDMEWPLGSAAGNGIEVAEWSRCSWAAVRPMSSRSGLALAHEMVALAGLDADPAAVLASGKAMDVWRAMIRAQGGDPDAPLPPAHRPREVLVARGAARCSTWTARSVGNAAWRLGAGRARKEDPVSPSAAHDCSPGPAMSWWPARR